MTDEEGCVRTITLHFNHTSGCDKFSRFFARLILPLAWWTVKVGVVRRLGSVLFPESSASTGLHKAVYFGVSFAFKCLEEEVMKFNQYKHQVKKKSNRLGF